MEKSQSEKYMRQCIDLAHEAAKTGNYPLGSMVVREGEVLAAVSSQLVVSCDPTAHPETSAIRQACEKVKSRYIPGAVLLTTLEPCPMCTSAAIWAKFDGIVYGSSVEDAIEWSSQHPESAFSWRMISTKCRDIVKTGTPKLWVQECVLNKECNALFDVSLKIERASV